MSVYQWLCLLGVQGVITLILSWVISKKLNTADAKAEQAKRETAAIAEGVKALLRDRLLQGYKHYIEKGWADMDDRANMENVWRPSADGRRLRADRSNGLNLVSSRACRGISLVR